MSEDNKTFFPKMLSMILIFLAILFFIPNITMLRLVKIGPIQESLAIFFFPFVYPIADAITEVHGKDKALFILSSCYLISLFFSILLMLSSYLPTPDGFTDQKAYDLVFHSGPRVIFAGVIAVGVSMFINIKLMARLKIKLRNRHFILRSIISSSIGELIVTCLAYPLIFLSVDFSIISLMINAYLFKVVYSIFGAFPAKWAVFLMRRIDGFNQEVFSKEFQGKKYDEVSGSY